MAGTKNKSNKNSGVNRIVKDYAEDLSQKIIVRHIFLFGSAARGEMKKNSDIDMIVISPNFSKMQFTKRLQFLSRASWNFADKIALDIIGYTPKEFAELKKSDSPTVQKMLKEGKMII